MTAWYYKRLVTWSPALCHLHSFIASSVPPQLNLSSHLFFPPSPRPPSRALLHPEVTTRPQRTATRREAPQEDGHIRPSEAMKKTTLLLLLLLQYQQTRDATFWPRGARGERGGSAGLVPADGRRETCVLLRRIPSHLRSPNRFSAFIPFQPRAIRLFLSSPGWQLYKETQNNPSGTSASWLQLVLLCRCAFEIQIESDGAGV